ncbi:MAG: hypothetical protein J6Y38_02910 [Bacteroidaceae bacterium]|nr:hypothetical protein [Bacteroidaceae bacterium]
MIVKKSAISVLLCLCALGMNAQTLKQQGTSAELITPEGWEHKEALGDLNKDGIKDLVVLAKPNFKENMMTRDDGYEYNFNPYILAIYFGQKDGNYKQWKQYKELFEPDSEWTSVGVDIEITERGTLNISTDFFASAGSYDTNQTKYTYRFQNGDFHLIGKESTDMARNTGEMTTVSENYLTWKRQTIKDNAFEEVMKKETWSKLTKTPLEKLGDHEL